jgi:hypothetical protein
MKDNEREKINQIFRDHIQRGGDIRQFLHLPVDMITPEIKLELDKFLAEEAYRNLDENQDILNEDMIVYRESSFFIYFTELEKKRAYLEKMLNFFTETENYEKCRKISNLLNKLNNAQGN